MGKGPSRHHTATGCHEASEAQPPGLASTSGWRQDLSSPSTVTAQDQSTISGAGAPSPHSLRAARPVRPQPAPGADRADWPVPAELDLQDLCTGTAESEELDGVWTSLFIFITLFLLSVTYSASVTVCKVGRRCAGRPRRRVGRGLTCILPQVQWVSAAVLRQEPPLAHDYVNVLEPAAWAWGAACALSPHA